MSIKTRSYVALVTICVVWGLSFPVMESLLTQISPLFFVFIRYFSSALIVTVVFLGQFLSINKRDILDGLIVGIPFSFAVSLQMLGLAQSSSTNTAFITGMTVVVIPIIILITKGILPSRITLLAIMFAFIGLFVMSGVVSSMSMINVGDGLVFLGTIAFAIQIINLENLGSNIDYTKLTIVQFYVVSVVTLILILFLDDMHFALSAKIGFQLLFIVFICSIMALLLQNKFQHNVSSTHVGIIFLLEPVAALIFALTLKHTVYTNQLIGAVIILVGTLLAIYDSKPKGFDKS